MQNIITTELSNKQQDYKSITFTHGSSHQLTTMVFFRNLLYLPDSKRRGVTRITIDFPAVP